MTDNIAFDIFNSQGKFSKDVTEEQVASLTPERLAAFEGVKRAAQNLETVGDNLKQAETDRKNAHEAFEAAKNHLDKVRPVTTALQMQRLMALSDAARTKLAREREQAGVSQEIKNAILKAAECEDLFEGSKVTVRALQNSFVDARGTVAKKIVAWQQSFPIITPQQLIRDHINAEQQRRIDGTNVSKAVQPVALCALDAAMNVKGGSRRASRHPDGAAGGRTYPQSMFNQRVAVPVAASVKPWQTKKLGTV